MAEAHDFWSLFQPLPRQVRFLQLSRDHRYLLYGGARGGGKSKLLRWGALWQLLEWAAAGHKNVRAGLFSEDYPTLRDRQLNKIRVEFPEWLGEVKSTQTDGLGFFLHEEYGGGAILLRNLDDPAKYQSAEFALVAVEELTKNPKVTFDILRGSLRWPGIEHTQFWAATNPGGIGHLWVKQLWVDRDFSGEVGEALAPLAHQFAFVQSLPSDNPHLPQSYWDELNSLPEGLRRAWVEGNWDAFEGQAISEWDRRWHVAEYEPPRSEGVWTGGGDWGYAEQGCFYLVWTGPERSLVRFEYLFRQRDPYDVGFSFGHAITRFPRPEWIAIDTPPVSDGGPTILERLQRGLNDAWGGAAQRPPVLVNPPKGPGSRHTKLQLLHEMLKVEKTKDGTVPPWAMPKLQFHPDCKYAIRTLPALPVDPTDSEDVDSDGDDHGYDAIASWIMARTPHVERTRRGSSDPDAHRGLAQPRQEEPRATVATITGGPQRPRWTRLPEE